MQSTALDKLSNRCSYACHAKKLPNEVHAKGVHICYLSQGHAQDFSLGATPKGRKSRLKAKSGGGYVLGRGQQARGSGGAL